MADKLFKQFKLIKNICPDANKTAAFEIDILNTPKDKTLGHYYITQARSRLLDSVYFAATVGLAAILIAFIATDIKENNVSFVKNDSQQKFDITLQDAKYYKQIAPNVYVVVIDDEEKN